MVSVLCLILPYSGQLVVVSEVDSVDRQGGLGIFGNIDLWTTAISPVLG